MRNYIVALLLVLAGIQFSTGQTQWNIDPMHTNVRFSVKHLGIAFVDGEFLKFEGTVESASDSKLTGGEVNFTIEVNSIFTRVDQRDAHLKSDDFFDAEQYPQIIFRHGKLEHLKDNVYQLTGELTMKDVTRKVTFNVIQNGIITDPWGNTRAGITATTTIDRTEFNINYNEKLPTGVFVVGKNIEVVVNAEMVKQ